MSDDKIESFLDGYTVQQYKSDIGFRTLAESVNDNLFVIPKYQRKYRWSKEQVIGLVESLLKGFPIPPIYTCRNNENQLEILDGQQRVMSLFFYYIGYFLNKRKESSINFSDLIVENSSFESALREQYPLEELHIDLEGMDGIAVNVDYASLPPKIKRKVDYTAITVIEIKIGQESRKEAIYPTIFANLNKNGTPLSKQELRNGIFMCKFYDMLQQFNRENEKWRKLWGRVDSSDKDLETLLRFCALRRYVHFCNDCKIDNADMKFRIEGYYNSYGEMMDSFSQEVVFLEDETIAQYRESLEGFVNLFDLNIVLASKTALMEGFYIIYEKVGVREKITRTVLESVQNTEGYKNNSGQRTVNIKKMNGRWKAVYEVWNGSLK